MRRFCFVLVSVTACVGVRAPGDIAGWEGFHRPADLTAEKLASMEVPFDRAFLEPILPRVARLILASGTREVEEAEVQAAFSRYCGTAEDRAWNDDRCAALEVAKCTDKQCTYEHFGSCTAFLLGGGSVLTAAHCIASLTEDPTLLERSKIVLAGPDGLPATARGIRIVRLGKAEFDKHWVTSDADALDVAVLTIEDGGLPPFPVASTPPRGGLVFVVGYPRVKRSGPKSVSGTPAVSFGRVDDENADDRPFCSTDGTQEGWALAKKCPTAAAEGDLVRRGPISAGNFTTTMDTINGYSGAPVFDAEGRLVGINSTVAGGVDPRSGYDAALRAVVTKAERVIALARPDS